MKSTQHHLSAGEYNLEPQCDVMSHLPECPKLKRLTPPNAGEDVEQLELPCFASGNVKQHNYFGETV